MINSLARDGGPPTKQMRLGTKSCSECRRRKVRCIFSPNSAICQDCTLHSSHCVPQQPKASTTQPTNHSENSEAQLLRRRLAALEDIVRGLPGSSYQTPASAPSDIRSTPENPSDDAVENFQSAPLISLFRDASLLQGTKPSSGAATGPISQLDDQVLDVLSRLQLLIPRWQSLALVAEATEMLWSTWPQYYYGPTRSDTIQAGQIQRTKETLAQAFNSGRPVVIAKTVSWLSLCLQQLPAEKAMQRYGLPDEPRRLVERYMAHVKRLLAVDDDTGSSLDGVECMMMQHRVNVDFGRPKQAWLWARRALTTAISLGIHRVHASTDQRRRDLWTLIWQFERQSAVMLGLPSAVSNSDPSLSDSLCGDSAMERIAHRVAVILGKLIERDQNHETVGYVTTMQLDQDAEEARKLFPDDWWEAPEPSASFATAFFRQSIKFQYFLLLQLIHLPYMLKSLKETKYIHSWNQAIGASESLLRCYCDFRQHPQAETSMCELMDFYAFSSAVTLAIGLLVRPSQIEGSTQEHYWSLLGRTRTRLSGLAANLGCRVAEQGAATLDLLIAARHGAHHSREDWSVTIPYFGKICLNFSKTTGQDGSTDATPANTSTAAGSDGSATVNMSSSGNTSGLGHTPPGYMLNIESDEFIADPFHGFDFEQELGGDWAAAGFDAGSFDWTEVFAYDEGT